MKSYLTRFFVGFYFIMLVTGICLYFGLGSVVANITFVLLLGGFIYYLDVKYLPQRKAKLASKLNEIFRAETVAEGVMKFNIDALDLFAKIEVDLTHHLQFANTETIRFYIPKHQVDQLTTKPGLNIMEDSIEGEQTYLVYQTNAKGLDLLGKAMNTQQN